MTTTAEIARKLPPVRTRQIAIPTEHGAWGFLLEPIVAGMAVAFSWTGLFIAVMMAGAFLSRQPLKVLVIDRLGMKSEERARASLKFLLIYGCIFAGGLAGVLVSKGAVTLWPILAVVPLACLQFYFDSRRNSRRLLPELGGAIAISASIAAIALAGGLAAPIALGLWTIMICRLFPSILYVRERLLLEKGKPHSIYIPLVAHLAGLLILTFLAYFRVVPVLPVLAMCLLLGRAAAGLSDRRRRMKAMQIGVLEVVYGALVAVSVVVGYHTGF